MIQTPSIITPYEENGMEGEQIKNSHQVFWQNDIGSDARPFLRREIRKVMRTISFTIVWRNPPAGSTHTSPCLWSREQLSTHPRDLSCRAGCFKGGRYRSVSWHYVWTKPADRSSLPGQRILCQQGTLVSPGCKCSVHHGGKTLQSPYEISSRRSKITILNLFYEKQPLRSWFEHCNRGKVV